MNPNILIGSCFSVYYPMDLGAFGILHLKSIL